jgi:hypothetical protein
VPKQSNATWQPGIAIKDYAALSTLNGNKRIAPTILKISPSVRPTIRKGRSTSQMMGKRNTMINARGQHNTNSIHHRISVRKILISQSFIPGL